MTEEDVAGIFATAYAKSASVKIAIGGFQKCGIVPFCKDLFTDEDFLGADATDQPLQEVTSRDVEPEAVESTVPSGTVEPPLEVMISTVAARIVEPSPAVVIPAISAEIMEPSPAVLISTISSGTIEPLSAVVTSTAVLSALGSVSCGPNILVLTLITAV